MIVLALFEEMANDKVAGLIRNKDFFYDEMPLQSDGNPMQGVWIISRGGSAQNAPKGRNLKMTVDVYVGYSNKTKTDAVAAKILSWILKHRCLCRLTGKVGEAKYDYENIRLAPTQTPQNMGATENGNIVKTVSAEIIYDLAR